jgi:hypothetical protein
MALENSSSPFLPFEHVLGFRSSASPPAESGYSISRKAEVGAPTTGTMTSEKSRGAFDVRRTLPLLILLTPLAALAGEPEDPTLLAGMRVLLLSGGAEAEGASAAAVREAVEAEGMILRLEREIPQARETLGSAEAVVVPDGFETSAGFGEEDLFAFLRLARARHKLLAASGSAVALLARAGVLPGVRVAGGEDVRGALEAGGAVVSLSRRT